MYRLTNISIYNLDNKYTHSKNRIGTNFKFNTFLGSNLQPVAEASYVY